MLLKSLVKRSFKYTTNSGAGRSNMREVACTASSISEMTLKALGPEEQPKSAMPMLTGQLEHRARTIAFLVAGFATEIILFYTNLQVICLKRLAQKTIHICLINGIQPAIYTIRKYC